MRFGRGRLFDFFIQLARANLFWESLWPALWPAMGIAGLFVAAALFDVFGLLPGWLHLLLVIGFALLFLLALSRVRRELRPIGRPEARHRIETDSDLAHRPLGALEDNLAAGTENAATLAIWRAHQERMAAATNRLRLKLPAAGLHRRDPWGLRVALVLVLAAGFLAAGWDAPRRLAAAFTPTLSGGLFGETAAVHIWINPPPYTARPPLFLRVGGKKAEAAAPPTPADGKLVVPAGSTITAQVTGGRGMPRLLVDDKSFAMKAMEVDSHHLEMKLPEGKRLSVEQNGRQIAAWSLTILADAPPEVGFSAAPDGTRLLRLRIPFAASDDYGLKSVTAIIRRIDGVAIPGGADRIRLRLSLPAGQRKKVKRASSQDLTAHVWAGLPVYIQLRATDDLGQVGLSLEEPAVLPERRFSHPVARQLIDLRRGLGTDRRSRMLAALELDNIAERPARFDNDTAVYLALRVGRERLQRDQRDTAVAEVQKMLWDTALGIEDGRAALAGQDLSAAQRKFLQALRNGADRQKLERLMRELQSAFNRFMRSLGRELQRRGELMPLDPRTRLLDQGDLQRMLDRARELMRQGSIEAARQLMAEFQRLLDSLRRGMARGGRMSESARQARRSLRELGEIVRRQQKLLDDTFRRSQDAEKGTDGQGKQKGAAGEAAGEQDAIRRKLGDIMRRFSEMLGKVPPNLDTAEQAMRQSGQALGGNRPGDSVGPQSRALEALRKGAQAAARMMGQRFGRGNRFGRGFGRRGFGFMAGPRLRGLRPANRDPFGRNIEDGATGSSTGGVKIPNASEMQRAREILKELRRRAGEPWRPGLERDSIDRLLRLF